MKSLSVLRTVQRGRTRSLQRQKTDSAAKWDIFQPEPSLISAVCQPPTQTLETVRLPFCVMEAKQSGLIFSCRYQRRGLFRSLLLLLIITVRPITEHVSLNTEQDVSAVHE